MRRGQGAQADPGRAAARRAGRLCGVRALVAARPRRRGGAAAAGARDSAGEGVGEGEEVAVELTRGLILGGEDRR